MSQRNTADSVRSVTRPVLLTDSLVKSVTDTLGKNGKKKFMPDPKRATRLALIPGFGQLYNRDYWKLPIIYLSMGGGIYAFHLNRIKYKDFLIAYEQFYDLDKNSSTYGQLKPTVTQDTRVQVRVRNLFATESEYVEATRDAIERQKNYWRRNKNLSIIVAGLIYSLTIVEANVAAHLKTFDLTDDLSMRIEPKLSQPMLRQPAPGLRLVFNIK
ncbi:DUF5683 domain-containing protein [Dyadobacter psychrotolerans]|uniref:DUF5683 domain-containing protein n=1 Tax=Dyadobacter psychrotolerans TaxID=2541721 RepID=A0A4R5DXM7_9BACT|nr:DUF5683 domain-containing protein [Dyadobacter psychrotolerans]TDE17414.1 hypothetical protein E0F88_05860 [Dyadobacter psychrotolerans]